MRKYFKKHNEIHKSSPKINHTWGNTPIILGSNTSFEVGVIGHSLGSVMWERASLRGWKGQTPYYRPATCCIAGKTQRTHVLHAVLVIPNVSCISRDMLISKAVTSNIFICFVLCRWQRRRWAPSFFLCVFVVSFVLNFYYREHVSIHWFVNHVSKSPPCKCPSSSEVRYVNWGNTYRKISV